jgi:hypothetical protein
MVTGEEGGGRREGGEGEGENLRRRKSLFGGCSSFFYCGILLLTSWKTLNIQCHRNIFADISGKLAKVSRAGAKAPF